MTQSGQGNDPQLPAVPPAHEGVVLPAHGDQGDQGRQQAAPAGGQPWGQPWGPQAAQQPPAQPQPPVQPQPYGQQQPAAQPPQQPAAYGYPPQQAGGYGYPPQQAGGYGYPPQHAGGYGYPPQQAGGYGYPPQQAGGYGYPPQQAGGYGYPPQNAGGYGYPQPAQPQQPQQQPAPPNPAQPAPPPYASQQPYVPQRPAQPQPPAYGQQSPAAPQPGPPPVAHAESTTVLRPVPSAGPQPPAAPAAPGVGDATQVIPPVTPTDISAAPTAAMPVVPPAPAPGGDGDATQLIPPVGASAPGGMPLPPGNAPAVPTPSASVPLPPERRREAPAESTTVLRPIRADGPQPPRGGAAPAPGAAEETTVLPGPIPAAGGTTPQPGGAPFAVRPGRPGERQPPMEFEGLFRDGAAASATPERPDSTQQLPVFDDRMDLNPPGAGRRDAEPRRGLSRGALIGIVVAGCAVAGLAAGALLSGGDEGGDDDKKSVNASSQPSADEEEPAPKESASPTADPVEAQAKALDTLLADSNDSRASVIAAVENIKTCESLGTAASDLRTAAQQRNNLVTRLGQISVDKLPNHTQLTEQLNKAWRASASADNHYAAWAKQVAGKKGCHKGKARRTGQVALAEQASVQATEAKTKAADLWNPIARKYTLTERRKEQL
ncbi:hypothetical protein [Streptomyces sp. SAJ15]|uniref:hypothetical protein n=1 Tax=Streptomyces sp. SAJ15 TaxID=2011095 RepID=UPI00118707C8|nr:hypothetical protein [Streptomyces sp. SAJ15]TVL90071.1 hypothetical protein CD790_23255 [Streptomyces sp. SAJ15]